MKKSERIFSIILTIICVIFLLQNVSLALTTTQLLKDADNWKDQATGVGTVGSVTQNIVGTAINVIRIVGTGISIIMLTYVAIKYMSAAPAEKAEFKKSATAMIVGAIVLFASSNILKVIANFADKNIQVGAG